jgi:putative transposase
MDCPHCGSAAMTERSERTALGYRKFRCRLCGRGFNERTGTLYNWLQYPTDIVLLVVSLVVLWRLRDLAEMFLERGFVFTHETVREWEAKLAPRVADELRKRRRGVVGKSWYVDETYIKVDGRWCYLFGPSTATAIWWTCG